MYHCLTKKELSILLEHKLTGKIVREEYLNQLIIAAQNWSYDLGSLNYCFSMILELRKKQGLNCEQLIDFLYNLSGEMSFEIHEMGEKLTDHMMHNLPVKNLSLEENLIDLQTNIVVYNYADAIRY